MKKLAYVIVGIFVLSLLAMVPSSVMAQAKPDFKYGVGGSPQTIDPHHAWDSASIDILDQVMEGLVGYNLTDPELGIIPVLATDLGTWNEDLTNITFTLRQEVTFHNGDPFNASVVVDSFDRLTYLLELAVATDYEEGSQLVELYEPLAQAYEDTPLVINKTVAVDEFTVTFVLNYPYVAFRALLCFSGSYIVHPSVPQDRLLELDEELIGTGPFVLESYSNTETVFTAYADYWDGKASIEK